MVVQRTFRIGGPTLLLVVSALVFGGSGAALIVLNKSDDPPALDRLDVNLGRLSGIRLRRFSGSPGRGIPRIQFVIGGVEYMLDSRRQAWLDSLRTGLRMGDTLTVWSRAALLGSDEIWQLARGDSIVVSYRERRERKIESNRRTAVLGELFLALGAAAFLAALFVRRR